MEKVSSGGLTRRDMRDCRESHKGQFVISSFIPYVVFALLELTRNGRTTSGNTQILLWN
jgi:hypothetical protein